MRIFKTEFGDVVDLDDPNTYSHLPQTTRECDDLMFREIGYYYCYVNFFHKDWDGDQIFRCLTLIQKFTTERKDNYNNLMWYQEQIFLFQDETENMC